MHFRSKTTHQQLWRCHLLPAYASRAMPAYKAAFRNILPILAATAAWALYFSYSAENIIINSWCAMILMEAPRLQYAQPPRASRVPRLLISLVIWNIMRFYDIAKTWLLPSPPHIYRSRATYAAILPLQQYKKVCKLPPSDANASRATPSFRDICARTKHIQSYIYRQVSYCLHYYFHIFWDSAFSRLSFVNFIFMPLPVK